MDDSKLIELVREHPSLFDNKHHLYKDVNARDNIWKEIAEELKQPVEECRSRWKNIRDTFMRRKRMKLATGSSRTKIFRKWHLEKQLAFLTHVACERKSLTNISTEETQGIHESQQIEHAVMEGDTDYPGIEGTETSIETKFVDANIVESNIAGKSEEGEDEEGKSAKKRKRSGDNIVRLFKKRNSYARSKLLSALIAKKMEEEHPIDIFFKGMAISVKKMTRENQIRAKMQICQIVGQLELEEIRSLSY